MRENDISDIKQWRSAPNVNLLRMQYNRITTYEHLPSDPSCLRRRAFYRENRWRIEVSVDGRSGHWWVSGEMLRWYVDAGQSVRTVCGDKAGAMFHCMLIGAFGGLFLLRKNELEPRPR